MMVSMAIAVLPVWRSPMISSRWPLPIGIMESIALIPVWSGTFTGSLVMMPEAIFSMGRVSFARIAPLPSMGCPREFTTRPRSSSPTGTETILPVRFTLSPSLMSASEPSITAPTKSCSRFSAMHCTPFSNSSSSFSIHFSSPCILTIPSPTVTTVPTSSRRIFEL